MYDSLAHALQDFVPLNEQQRHVKEYVAAHVEGLRREVQSWKDTHDGTAANVAGTIAALESRIAKLEDELRYAHDNADGLTDAYVEAEQQIKTCRN